MSMVVRLELDTRSKLKVEVEDLSRSRSQFWLSVLVRVAIWKEGERRRRMECQDL